MDWIRSTLALAKSGSRPAKIKLASLVLAAVVIAGFAFSTGDAPKPQQTITANSFSAPKTSIDASLWVHIVGAVAHPGVYAVDTGSRLYEVVASAGGFTKKADQTSVNLARQVTDGEQIRVTVRGEGASTNSSQTLLSLNGSSAATLETLPGVGPKLAARIVDWRKSNAGFKTVADLRKVGGIGDKLFAQLKDLVSI
jgi:competence protein ComEA